MGMDALPKEIVTIDDVVKYFISMSGTTDLELVEHEPITDMGEPWTRTLWTVHNGQILCHLLYGPEEGWGYRLIPEAIGPCMFNCPLRMLEAVPLPESYFPWALEWRNHVLNYHCVPTTIKERVKYLRRVKRK